MAVRYFCDNCGNEARVGELEVLVISIPPQSETFDVCPACVRHFRGELQRCGEAKQKREIVAAAPATGRALAGSRAALALPGVTAFARGVSYVAIFLALFVAVTLLSSLR
jgi:hypothetical protein